jgi:hypothetical protein
LRVFFNKIISGSLIIWRSSSHISWISRIHIMRDSRISILCDSFFSWFENIICIKEAEESDYNERNSEDCGLRCGEHNDSRDYKECGPYIAGLGGEKQVPAARTATTANSPSPRIRVAKRLRLHCNAIHTQKSDFCEKYTQIGWYTQIGKYTQIRLL